MLSESEVERVLSQARVEESLGLRDRAMMEVLYSTGMRRMGLAGLSLQSVDGERGAVLIREGKGKKDRMVPIGERAVAWVEKYVREVRPLLVVPPDGGARRVAPSTCSRSPARRERCAPRAPRAE